MNIAVMAVFALLLIVDIATTRYIVSRGGRELNPIYQGNPTLAKLILTHALVLSVACYALMRWTESTIAGFIAVAIYMAVCINNIRVARALQKPTEQKS